MNLRDYQKLIDKFDLYPEAVERLLEKKSQYEIKQLMVTMLHCIGLAGEVGELTEKIKKSIRDNYDLKLTEDIAKELGDCEWYLSRLESDFKVKKSSILMKNYEKLSKRLEENKLHGTGDNR